MIAECDVGLASIDRLQNKHSSVLSPLVQTFVLGTFYLASQTTDVCVCMFANVCTHIYLYMGLYNDPMEANSPLLLIACLLACLYVHICTHKCTHRET